MSQSLSPKATRAVEQCLKKANRILARRYPGETGRRQPVHTVYGGAHLFKADVVSKLGTAARRALAENASDFVVFARAIGLRGAERLPESAPQAPELRLVCQGPQESK